MKHIKVAPITDVSELILIGMGNIAIHHLNIKI